MGLQNHYLIFNWWNTLLIDFFGFKVVIIVETEASTFWVRHFEENENEKLMLNDLDFLEENRDQVLVYISIKSSHVL